MSTKRMNRRINTAPTGTSVVMSSTSRWFIGDLLMQLSGRICAMSRSTTDVTAR